MISGDVSDGSPTVDDPVDAILRLLDSRPDFHATSDELLAEGQLDSDQLRDVLERMSSNGLIGQVQKDGPVSDTRWYANYAPRLHAAAEERVRARKRILRTIGSVPMEDSYGNPLLNVRTTSTLRSHLTRLGLPLRESIRQRLQDMVATPEQVLLPIRDASEFVLKITEYRAIVAWDRRSDCFLILHVGFPEEVYR